MEGWTDFFVAEVGAAAALAGLLVVAISINIEKILAFPTLPARAAQTLFIISGALVIASFALLPRQPLLFFGLETTVVAVFVAASGAFEFAQSTRRRGADDPLMWMFVPLLVVAMSALPELVGGILLVAGSDSGLYWIGIGIILSFVATLQNGWVLLVEILR